MLERNLYAFWTENNEITPRRKNNLVELKNRCGVNFKFINYDEIKNYELPDHKFHEGYNYISATAKSDYLRTYFMHFYGGGYVDIKFCDFNWNPYFDHLDNSDKFAIGYQALEAANVAVDPLDPEGPTIQSQWQELIGAGAMICKPQTQFTQDWWNLVNMVLDKKLEELKSNPAKHVRDKQGWVTQSGYPLRWAELGPETLFKACYKNKDKIIVGLPRPDLNSKYR